MAQARLVTDKALVAEIEATLAELEEALDLIRRTSGEKAYIGFSGGIFIEVSKDEAIEYIERRKRSLRAILEKLKSEAKE